MHVEMHVEKTYLPDTKGVCVSRAETIMPRWVCAPKYRLRNCSKCLSRSEMQSRRVGFGTAARVLRTINMNYGKRSQTGPPSLPPPSSPLPERSGSSEAHRGAAVHIRSCIRRYGSRHRSRREYITMHFFESRMSLLRFVRDRIVSSINRKAALVINSIDSIRLSWIRASV